MSTKQPQPAPPGTKPDPPPAPPPKKCGRSPLRSAYKAWRIVRAWSDRHADPPAEEK